MFRSILNWFKVSLEDVDRKGLSLTRAILLSFVSVALGIYCLPFFGYAQIDIEFYHFTIIFGLSVLWILKEKAVPLISQLFGIIGTIKGIKKPSKESDQE